MKPILSPHNSPGQTEGLIFSLLELGLNVLLVWMAFLTLGFSGGSIGRIGKMQKKLLCLSPYWVKC